MTRQALNLGSQANDGTGDTLRIAGQKINQNFAELYTKLGGSDLYLSSGVSLTNLGVVFEGTVADDHQVTLSGGNPTVDRSITLPDASGEITVNTATQTLTNKTLSIPTLTTPYINDLSSTHTYRFVAGELSNNRNVNLPVLLDSDTFVFSKHSQTLTNKTLTTPTISSPIIQTGLNDANNVSIVGLTPTASADCYVNITNANVTQPHHGPKISAAGVDTNVTLKLAGKNAGAVELESPVAYDEGGVEITATGSTVSLTTAMTIFNAGGNITTTLPVAQVNGLTKRFINRSVVGNVQVNETVSAPLSNGSSFTIRPGGYAEATWYSDRWYLKTDKNYDSSDTDALVFVTA